MEVEVGHDEEPPVRGRRERRREPAQLRPPDEGVRPGPELPEPPVRRPVGHRHVEEPAVRRDEHAVGSVRVGGHDSTGISRSTRAPPSGLKATRLTRSDDSLAT